MLTATNSLEPCIKCTGMSHYSSFFPSNTKACLVSRNGNVWLISFEKYMRFTFWSLLGCHWNKQKAALGSLTTALHRPNAAIMFLFWNAFHGAHRIEQQAALTPFCCITQRIVRYPGVTVCSVRALLTHSSDSFSPLIDCYPNIPQIASSFVSGR